MEAIFNTTEFTVSQLIEKIDTGDLGLPELQRPFVWKNTKIRDLFDSMMSGYPVGYLMLWECPELHKTKSIGSDAKSYDEPKEVIIDGQQRLTSLYAVMKGRKVIDSDFRERSITISFCPRLNKFEVGTAAIKNNPEWIYNLSDLFTSSTSARYIRKFLTFLEEKRGFELTDDEQEQIEMSIEAVFNLKNYKFPVFMIKSNADEEAVSQVFVRINSGGTPLKQNDFILTLLSVHWEEGRREIERFCRESTVYTSGATTAFNSIGIEISPQDIIRTVMAYGFNRARLMYGYKLLRGADLDNKGAISRELMEQNFSVLKEKLPDVISPGNWHEFLKSVMKAGYLYEGMISSNNAVFYTYAMYLIAKYRLNVPNDMNDAMSSLWLFHALLTSLYTVGSNETTAENHLNALKSFTTPDEYRRFIIERVEERMTDDFFDVTLPGSEGLAKSGSGNNAWFAYVASLNILGTRILFSHSNLPASTLFMPGTDGTRKALEKHHLFPKAYLKPRYSDTQINQMANYANIEQNDNMKILDEAPSEYYPVVCEGMTYTDILRMEEENALPHGWQNMNYDEFLVQRRKLMAAIIKKAYEVLKTEASS